MLRSVALGVVTFLTGCAKPSLEHARWQPLETDSSASLRGEE
ncbi:MAG TPA: hypothetical protein QF499_11215 [Gammaproteobacteria bacterium]|nr:hypothetical protein [Gammaproteobacteria bacterium]MDP7659899.1 hypothetical protein [Gammaproteobacteria bacterium]HJP39679.1 hypothetical protein [Gammaproteobacteria bacterium]